VDILALIQVLALDQHSHRSEAGLREELQGSPQSADSWTDVARRHPEFFRVRPTGENIVSLLARHISIPSAGGRPPLELSYVQELVKAAISLHDRALAQSYRHIMVPLVGVIIGGLLTLLGTFLAPWLK
jgi:hypothetical protein